MKIEVKFVFSTNIFFASTFSTISVEGAEKFSDGAMPPLAPP